MEAARQAQDEHWSLTRTELDECCKVSADTGKQNQVACFTVSYLNSGFAVVSPLKNSFHPAVIRADDPDGFGIPGQLKVKQAARKKNVKKHF